MSVLIVGISHRTAPVSLLERVTLGLGDTGEVLGQLETGVVDEAVVLATCNRVEVYADAEHFHPGLDAVSDLLARRSGVPLEDQGANVWRCPRTRGTPSTPRRPSPSSLAASWYCASW